MVAKWQYVATWTLDWEISDFNSTLDDITLPERNVLDVKSNRYGDYLVDFLVDSKCCVTNGKGDRALDNYTSVSKKGKAVVDYVIVPECVDKYGLSLHSKVRPPDHSLICCQLNLSAYRIYTTTGDISDEHSARKTRTPVNQSDTDTNSE